MAPLESSTGAVVLVIDEERVMRDGCARVCEAMG